MWRLLILIFTRFNNLPIAIDAASVSKNISRTSSLSSPLIKMNNNNNNLNIGDNIITKLFVVDERSAGTTRVEFTFGTEKNYILGNYTYFGNDVNVNGLLVKVSYYPVRF